LETVHQSTQPLGFEHEVSAQVQSGVFLHSVFDGMLVLGQHHTLFYQPEAWFASAHVSDIDRTDHDIVFPQTLWHKCAHAEFLPNMADYSDIYAGFHHAVGAVQYLCMAWETAPKKEIKCK